MSVQSRDTMAWGSLSLLVGLMRPFSVSPTDLVTKAAGTVMFCRYLHPAPAPDCLSRVAPLLG